MLRTFSCLLGTSILSLLVSDHALAIELANGDVLVGAANGIFRVAPSTGDRERIVDFGGNNQFVGGIALGPDGNLYATAIASLPYSSRLMRYDPIANETTLVRNLGFVVGGGVAFDGGDILVALRSSDPGGGGTVVRIDRVSGDLTSVNSPSTTAYDVLAGPGSAYYVASSAGILRVDESTGIFSHLSTLPTGGLTWGRDGSIYATTLGSRVFRVNPETGDSIDVVMSAGGIGGGLAFDLDSSLLVSYRGSGIGTPDTIGGNLSRFATPGASQEILTGFGAIYDVLVVPEPTSPTCVLTVILFTIVSKRIAFRRRNAVQAI